MFTLTCALPPARRLFALVAVLCLISGARLTAAAVDTTAIPTLEATQAGFHMVQTKVAPAVVTIASTAQVRASTSGNPFGDVPGMGAPRQQRTQTVHVSGSGVIVRADGYVLTNSHVVQDSTQVTVQLAGSEKKLPAKVVQTDPRTDLAVVKITEKGTYPTATLGDAKTVQAGDWAIAFGSPYGLPSTMTVGVISATGRKLDGPVGDFNYYDLLQTDASINHGNSGGPLVNIRGEVIGINFMIFSPGEESGSIGIGFAIPINETTKKVVETLITGKAVERGLIGIQVDKLSDAMREQFGVPDGGVLIQDVIPGMAGEKAGLKEEDVITEFNGAKVTDRDQFVNMVQSTAPGSKVTMTVVRNKKPMQVTVTIGTDATKAATANDAPPLDEQKVGLAVMAITPEFAKNYNLPVTSGVIVTGVDPDGPAAGIGLQRGDIILRVGGDPVNTVAEFWKTLAKKMALSKLGVLLRVRSGDHQMTLTLPPLEKQPDADK
ncbi:MAG TPA: trypsin-like peptidase domain-containing protein [Armatimonadota bacterium]|jgi:serine protease Do